jgi:hypothetical protein
MGKNTVVEFRGREASVDPLTELLRASRCPAADSPGRGSRVAGAAGAACRAPYSGWQCWRGAVFVNEVVVSIDHAALRSVCFCT